MHEAGRHAVEAGNESRARMGECDSTPWRWDAYLARMEMTREDQVERIPWYPVDDAGEVAEQQSKRRFVVDEAIWPCPSVTVRDGVDTRDLQALPVVFEVHLVVGEKRRVLQITKLGGP